MIRAAAAGMLLFALTGCAASVGPDPWRIGEGEMRKERMPLDARFTNADLTRNFRDIALRAEFSEVGKEPRALTLTRWEDDIEYRLIGGTAADHDAIAEHVETLDTLTGVDFTEVEEDGNMTIAFLPREGRADAARAVVRDIGAFEMERIAEVWARRSGDACIVMTRLEDAEGAVISAAVMIKDELEPIYRNACIIEELAQAMGLLNDSPDARPSIFNDDQEFVSLTGHDEYLLRILYDERLEPGMDDAAALPIVATIAGELRPDESLLAGRQ